jgi:hypothetical protein
MTLILIIVVSVVVVISVAITFFTSVNSGASRFTNWIEKVLDDKPEEKK